MDAERSGVSRRAFLAGAPAAAAGLLGGCMLAPGSRWWEATTWAERLGELVARPFSDVPVKEYPASAITAEFPIRSLNLDPAYAEGLGSWRLEVDGLVDAPRAYTLEALRTAFPRVAHTTRHDCVEGWSAIAEFAGVRVTDLLAAVRPRPEARYMVCHAADFDDAGSPYYGSLTLRQAAHPQVLLAYEMNGAPLPVMHGAPLRLRVPNQLGYKSTKFVYRVSLVASLAGLGRGAGGYWEDAGYEHWAGI